MNNIMNSPNIEQLLDPKFYLENFCKIKGKEKGLEPFILKPAQLDLFNTLSDHNRVIVMKARQIGFCVDKDTKVLSNKLEWIRAEDINVGQEIVSVDEFPEKGKGKARRMRKAIIEAKWDVFEDSFKITMGDGRTLIATGQHRFLSLGRIGTTWRTVDDTNVGDVIRYITTPWNEPDYEDGWFSGMIDGEGCLSKKNRSGVSLTISQIEGPVWDRLEKYAKKYSYRVEMDKRTRGGSSKLGDKQVNKIVFSRLDEVLEILGKLRPSRLINRDWWEDKELPNNGWSNVVSIEPLGKRHMIDLQTSEKTFIANGFVSHNSTAVTGYFYHKTIVTSGVTTAIVGYNNDLTAELLDKIKTFYRTTPDALKPTIHYNSKFEISFPKVDSKILVLPSTENVGRGYTINYALLTEVPFWDKAEEKMVTLEASVPVNGIIVIESSPGAIGDYFHRLWVSDNDYAKKEYGWWWNYSKEEIEIIRRRMNNPRQFNNNYALEFLTSGRAVFDMDTIREQRKNQLKVGDVVKLDDGSDHIVREEEGFRIYKPVKPGAFYSMGVDTAEGVSGGDYSVATVFDRTNGEEVGFWRGHMAPDRLAKVLDKWGRYYNNALMVVESEQHGAVVINILKQLLYPSMYFRPAKFDTIANPWSEKLGWKTTKVTRPILVDDFEEAVRSKTLVIHSKETLDEMTVFVYNDANNQIAMQGYHDDCIFSAAISLQGFKVLSGNKMDQLDERKHLPSVGY